MQQMMRQYGMSPQDLAGMDREGQTLVLNTNHKLVQYLLSHQDGDNVKTVCEELYDLARIQQAPLQPDAMTRFVQRTNEILGLLAKD